MIDLIYSVNFIITSISIHYKAVIIMSTARDGPVKSLVELSERKLLRELYQVIKGPYPRASYYCSGSIPIASKSNLSPAAGTSGAAPSAQPVLIAWNSPNRSESGRICFPLGREPYKGFKRSRSMSGLGKLLRHCSLSRTVYEGSSKPLKMHHTQFSVHNFHPVHHQIAAGISQILLPLYGPKATDRQEIPERTIFAELSQLQVGCPIVMLISRKSC